MKPILDSLTDEFNTMFDDMQKPGAADAMQRAFDNAGGPVSDERAAIDADERAALDLAEGAFFREHGPRGDWKGHDLPLAIWRAAMAFCSEQDARKLELTDSEIRLMAGEMTAAEMRTVKAVLRNRAVVLRREP